MGSPSARTVALRDQILAALRAESPLPISTRRVCELLGAHRYDETGYRIYPQLCALDRLGIVERLRRGGDCRDVFWRFLGDPTEADFNAAVDAAQHPKSEAIERRHRQRSDELTKATLATLDRYIAAFDVAQRRFAVAASSGDTDAETGAADELAALARQFVDVWTNWPLGTLVSPGRRAKSSQGLSPESRRQQPASDVHAWARSAAVGSPLARMILVVLADGAKDDRTACISLRALVEQSGAARSTVLRALNDLEERGLLSRRSQFDADGARLPSRYHLNCAHSQRLRGPATAARSARGVPSRRARAYSVTAERRWKALPPLLPVADAAPLLGISPHTVYRLIARDELPVRRVGSRRVYIDTARLRDLLDPLPR